LSVGGDICLYFLVVDLQTENFSICCSFGFLSNIRQGQHIEDLSLPVVGIERLPHYFLLHTASFVLLFLLGLCKMEAIHPSRADIPS
jgi:ABC-type uncharacterized transport system permease subunit